MRVTLSATALATTLSIGMAVPLAVAGPSAAGQDGSVSDARAARASLSMSPTTDYLPGSDLTLTGALGVSGRHRVVVQRHMGRVGDRWIPIAGSETRTSKDGSFSLHVPASGMNGISYRVASTTSLRATPSVLLNAAIQETLVSAQAADYGDITPGAPVVLTVDTTVGSGSFAASPPLAGRGLTLQQRVDGFRWATIATSATDAEGNGAFTVTAPATPGQAVYRVRQEDWHVGLDRVGWHASHPVYVTAVAPSSLDEPTDVRRPAAIPPGDLDGRAMSAQSTAGATYKWRDAASDFDWEYGESLTTPATRGTRLRGWWSDYSDGTGRVAVRNGAALISSLNEYGSRDAASLGSTWMTLNGNPRRYGRWETRVLPTGWGAGATEMRVRVELVPTSAAEQQCSPHAIVLADYTPSSTRVSFGARTSQQWTRSVATGSNNAAPHAFAVEVAKDHLTWFVDGRPVGTLKDMAALPAGPLTLRVGLIGDHSGTNMRAKLGVDWVRSWGLKHGKQVKRARSFAVGAPAPC